MGDGERGIALLVSLLLGCLAPFAAPLLIWRGRRKTPQDRTMWARSVLGVGIVILWWLDAVVVMHAFDVEAGHPFARHACVGGFFALVYLALMPLQGNQRKEAVLGTLALVCTAFGVIAVPWSADKRGVLDVERIAGQPLATVQTVMADYLVDVHVAGSNEPLPLAHDTRVRDLDLVALEPTELVFLFLGGCSVEIDSGRVGRIYFNYD